MAWTVSSQVMVPSKSQLIDQGLSDLTRVRPRPAGADLISTARGLGEGFKG
jgi:hypothetical protein